MAPPLPRIAARGQELRAPEPGQRGAHGTVAGTTVSGEESEPHERDPFVGRILANKYRVDRATQLLLDKIVAIKVLHAALGFDDKFQSRFQREAKAASRLDHPNSVHILDLASSPTG
jgi:hypothetical protein